MPVVNVEKTLNCIFTFILPIFMKRAFTFFSSTLFQCTFTKYSDFVGSHLYSLHKRTHVSLHTCTHAHMHTCTHAHTCTYKHSHARTHAYTHTRICVPVVNVEKTLNCTFTFFFQYLWNERLPFSQVGYFNVLLLSTVPLWGATCTFYTNARM